MLFETAAAIAPRGLAVPGSVMAASRLTSSLPAQSTAQPGWQGFWVSPSCVASARAAAIAPRPQQRLPGCACLLSGMRESHGWLPCLTPHSTAGLAEGFGSLRKRSISIATCRAVCVVSLSEAHGVCHHSPFPSDKSTATAGLAGGVCGLFWFFGKGAVVF